MENKLMDPNLMKMTLVLSNDVNKMVFKEVLKRRRVQFKDLRESITKAGSGEAEVAVHDRENVVQKQVEDAVEQLKNVNLIDERPAEIKDFNTYYVTEDGLNAESLVDV
jgi:uncharacterized protein (DUF2235 family)